MEMPLLPRGFASKFELRPTSDYEKLARSAEDSSSFGRFKVRQMCRREKWRLPT
jgi:hypothetical protein